MECMWKTLLKGWGSKCAQVDDSRIKKQEHGSKKEVGNGIVLGCPCDKCSLCGEQELQTQDIWDKCNKLSLPLATNHGYWYGNSQATQRRTKPYATKKNSQTTLWLSPLTLEGDT